MSSNTPIDISNFDKETFDDWINSFDVVLSDCDGVLWLHDHLYEGSNDAINKFVELGKKVYLITNNNQTSRDEMVQKCKKMNFNLELESMICSAHATAQHMRQIGFEKKAYVIGSKVLAEELEAVGITTLGSGPDVSEDSLQKQVMKDLQKIDEEVGAVVIGFDHHFSFPKLFKAVNYLRDPSIGFFATNTDTSIDFPGFTFPDAGALVSGLEVVSGRTATVIGKPSKLIREVSLKHEAHRDSNKFLMIGDRLDTDILFGKINNFQTLLVGTGVHKLEDVKANIEKIKSGEGDNDAEYLIPDFYISALKNLFKK